MFCAVCGAAAQQGQKFCVECGAKLDAAGPGPVIELTGETPAAVEQWQVVEQTPMAPPSWSAPGSAPGVYDQEISAGQSVQPPPPPYDPGVQPVYETPGYGQGYAQPGYAQPGYAQPEYVQPGYDQGYAQPGYPQDGYQAYGTPGYAPTAAIPTYQQQAPVYGYGAYQEEELRRVTPLGVLTIVAGIAAAATLAVDVVAGTTDGAKVSVKMADIANNNTVAAVVIAIAAVIAAILGAGVRRLGTGLAGGVGLGAAGWAGINIAAGLSRLDTAEAGAILGGARTFTKTFDVGFFLLVAVAVLGILAFVLSLPGSGADGLPKLPIVSTLVGVVGSAAIAFGPLIPQKGAAFADNFATDVVPTGFIIGRLAMLALLAFAGLVGFINARRWGLGTALGGIIPAAALWASALFGDNAKVNMGIGIANINGEPSKPHIVTTLGVILVIGAVILAFVLAQQAARAEAAHAQAPMA